MYDKRRKGETEKTADFVAGSTVISWVVVKLESLSNTLSLSGVPVRDNDQFNSAYQEQAE